MSLNNTCIEWMDNEISFERYRNVALMDNTNPNRHDFTKEKLSLNNHVRYGVIFSNGKPVCMGGLFQIDRSLYRLKNRFYIFPEFRVRTVGGAIDMVDTLTELMLKPLTDLTPDATHIITMANRGESNKHFHTLVRLQQRAWPNHWHLVDGYIQTGNGMQRRSWQCALTDNSAYPFKTLSHDQWLLLKDYGRV